MKYKAVLCLLLSVIVAYADDKEEKVNAAVSLKDMLTVFGMIKWCSKGACTLKHSLLYHHFENSPSPIKYYKK